MQHRIVGACHCGAVGIAFTSGVPPHELALRACQCGFCRRHAARTFADPRGRAVIVAREPGAVGRYRFGLATSDFLICARCGTYAGALHDGAAATLNANLFDAALFAREATPVDYEGESAAERAVRRAARWTPAVLVERQVVRADAPEAVSLLAAYAVELAALLGGFDPALGVSVEEIPFVVLLDGERPLACAGLRTHAPGVGEIKRMYVTPEARGLGLGQALLAELEREARALAMKRVVLDTAAPLAAAARLYLSAGYAEVPPFNDNPYAAKWFAKDL